MGLLLLAIGLTFVLGCATALAFYLVGGQLALNGPYVLGHAWPFIYSLEAAFAAFTLALVGFVLARQLSAQTVLVVVIGAWIGQYLVLASGVLADELNPLNSLGYWLMATGGLMQPISATIGG